MTDNARTPPPERRVFVEHPTRLLVAVLLFLTRTRPVAWYALAAIMMYSTPGAAGAERVTIGVLAHRGTDAARLAWQQTADYLGASIPGHEFGIVPLDLGEMRGLLAARDIDFVLTNPGHYVELESTFGISRLATIKRRIGERDVTHFGAVIITRADNDAIRTVRDLAGRSFAAVSRAAFGGFQMAWRILADNGMDPFNDLAELRFVGFPQDQIVYAVERGLVEAGTVRSETFARMAAEGLVRAADFRVLNARKLANYPLPLSTGVYPEWPFATATDTDPRLAQAVAVALFQLPDTHPAARAARISGWTIPLDYSPVHRLFEALRIGPYAPASPPGIGAVLREYGLWLFAIALALFALAGVTVYVLRVNRDLARSQLALREEIRVREHTQRSLAEHRDQLELRVRQRTGALQQANRALADDIRQREALQMDIRRRQAELAHVTRVATLGEMATGLAHELNQPLTAVVNYTRGCIRRLAGGEHPELLSAMRLAVAQAERAAEIIRHLREFLSADPPERTAVNINDAIAAVLDLARPEISRGRIELITDFATPLPEVHADRIQLEQVILNLLHNAMESSAGANGPRRINIHTAVVDGRVTVRIRDHGRGFGDTPTERVFEPFFSDKPNGMGMGLAISRTIAHAHGGDLYARPAEPPPGAEFCLSLPVSGHA